MFASIILSLAVATAATPIAAPAAMVQRDTTSTGLGVPAIYDGRCYYPTADPRFDLNSYLGRWYQVASSVTLPFTLGCSCVYAEYSLNADGTIGVFNACQRLGLQNNINGTATASPAQYGAGGVLSVKFPGQPTELNPCQGPNYVVQDYEGDWAIVQSALFSDLFILSRNQNPSDDDINAYLAKAQSLGSNIALVTKTSQTGCLYL